MRNIALLIAAAASLSMLACAAPQADEDHRSTNADIVGGSIDNGHMEVGYVEWEVTTKEGTGTAHCSSALVAPNVVLTAAHCMVPSDKTQTWKNHIVYFGNEPGKATADDVYKVVTATAHPSYNPAVLGAYDVAIFVLDRDVKGIKPAKMARTIGDIVGQPVTHVGWGTSISNSATDKQGVGTKRQVSLPITQQQDLQIRTGNGKSGVCNGDSGGPALVTINGVDVVIGVHSWVDDAEKCAKNGYSARVDRYVDFFKKFAPNSFADVQDDAKGTQAKPPAKGAAGKDGQGAGQCCLNNQCFTCPTKAAMDRCVGVDLDGCFSQCGQNPNCLLACADKLSNAKHDPSGCQPSGQGGNPGQDGEDGADGADGEDGADGRDGCSVSVQCTNGDCRCGGAKAGASCNGQSGKPNSCDVVCRVCN